MASTGQPLERSVDVKELGSLIRKRRAAEGLSLRELQDQLGNVLSASALSRIEHGATPEPKNVAPLAEWLGIPIENIGWPGQPTRSTADKSTPDVVGVHLRADRNLNPVAADVLAQTFRRLYDDIVSGKIPLDTDARKR